MKSYILLVFFVFSISKLFSQCIENNPICSSDICLPVQIDVLILYTPGAKNDADFGNGSHEVCFQKILEQINLFNFISTQSGVIHSLRLVHVEEIDYVAESSAIQDWRNLENSQHPVLGTAHVLRDRYGADLVSLIVENNSTNDSTYGAGNLPTCESGFIDSRAFSAITVRGVQPGVYSFIHEIGHNLGLNHDRNTVVNGGCGVDMPIDSIFCPDMFGFSSPDCVNCNTTGNRWRTIMGKNCHCTNMVSCTRIPYWSNPNVDHPTTGESLGTSGLSNAALGINKSACEIVDYRPSAGSRFEDSLALVELYHMCGGAFWTNQWDLASPLDNWHGISTTSVGRVNSINLSNNNLAGTLPDLVLQVLEILQLDNNFITGVVPDFSYLKALTVLDLSGNNLSGEIPNFSNLPQLSNLSLTGNNLNGNIPLFTNCVSLTTLFLGGNNLNGSIPNINLPALEWLNLNSNELTGDIPNFSNLVKMEIFSANDNKLTGVIPTFNHSHLLKELYIEDNCLTGEVPDLSILSNIELVYLKNNQFTFEDILPNYSTNENTTNLFNYYPQQQVGEEKIIDIALNGDHTLCIDIDNDITTNTYKWYKGGTLIATTDINEYTLEDLGYSDAGVYYCEVTNPNAPDLTLLSRETTINIVTESSPPFAWEQNYGEYYTEVAYDACISNDGTSYIVCGYCSEVSDRDFCVKKLNQSGGIIWEKTYGGTGSDRAFSIVPSISGQGYMCIGYSNSTDGNVGGNYGGFDLWLIAIAENGNLLWDKNYGGSNTEFAKKIIPTNTNDGYIILGETYSSDEDIIDHEGMRDYWALRIDLSGNKIWSRAFGGTDDDYAEDIVPAIEGDGYVVVGWTESNDGDLPPDIPGLKDAWYFKISENGNIVWNENYNHPGSQLLVGAITPNIDNDGYVIAAKAYGPYVNISSNNSVVYSTFEVSSVGEVSWIRYLPTNKSIDIHDICISNNGDGYLFCGMQYPRGRVVKVDASGNLFWEKGSPSGQNYSIMPTITGDGYLVGGYTNDELVSNGTFDWWLFQLDGSAPVPVELEHFIGYEKEDINRLEWRTLSEENISKYIIERSVTGVEWEEIGITNASGNYIITNDYQFDDRFPLETAYYRLNIIDNGYEIEYSPVIHIGRETKTVFSVDRLFPNPASEELLIELSHIKGLQLEYVVINIYGDEVHSGLESVSGDTHSLKLPLSHLPSGIYFISIYAGDEMILTRFVKT